MRSKRPVVDFEEGYFFDDLEDEKLDNAIDLVLDLVKNNPSLSDEQKTAISALIKMGLFIQHPETIGDLAAFKRIVDHLNKKREPNLQIPHPDMDSEKKDPENSITEDEKGGKKESLPENDEVVPLPNNSDLQVPLSDMSSEKKDREDSITEDEKSGEKESLPENDEVISLPNNPVESNSDPISPPPENQPDKGSSNPSNKKGGRKPGQGNRKKCDRAVNLQIMLKIDDEVSKGQKCPSGCGGTLGNHSHHTRYVVEGSPIFTSNAYELETTRCSVCRTLFRAKLPEEIGKVDPKSGWTSSAKAMAPMTRFRYGIPASRLESFQDVCGTFVSDTQLHAVCQETYESLLPLWDEMQSFFTDEADFQIVDDGNVHLIEEKKELEELPSSIDRSGNFVTAGFGCTEDKKVFIFKSSSFHMGEKLLQSDTETTRTKKVVRLMDGSPCGTINKPSPLQIYFEVFNEDSLLKPSFCIQVANCWQHVRSHLKKAQDAPKQEVSSLLDDISDLYKRHTEWKNENFSLSQETELREQVSEFFEKVRELSKRKTIEPSSKYGKALTYILNREDPLQVFLDNPGLPMDTNIVERAIKMHHRYNHNSLHFNNQNGADIGDFFMSLFHTADEYQLNPFDYLTNLIEFSEEVQKAPKEWLPWNYPFALEKARESRAHEKNQAVSRNEPKYDTPHKLKGEEETFVPTLFQNESSASTPVLGETPIAQ